MTLTKIFLSLVILVVSVSPAIAQTYSDPVPYCKAVGTIDKPDARYSGPKLPVWMANALNMKPDQGKLMEWRCAKGTVLACQYGANIPCDSKAVTSQKPAQAIIEYCRQNPGSDFVPMYVIGHDSAVSWACKGPTPAAIHSASVDAQGYQASYWRKVSP